MSTNDLLEPLVIGRHRVPGRVFKSATSETRAHPDGRVSDELLEFYEPVVDAGTPLVITGNLYVSLQGRSTERMAGIDSDDKLTGLGEWAQLLRKSGGLAVAQLNHAGRQIVGTRSAVSASGVREPLMGTKPRPLHRDELPGIAEDFASAAWRAAEAGFNGVQIHCAHGYLLNQFLTPHTNRRKDEYGGSLDNRMRLVLEVLRAVRTRVGDDVAVIAKINGTDALGPRSGASTAEFVEVARAMQEEGLDAVEISRGHYASGPGMVAGTYRGFVTTMIEEGGGQSLTAWRRAGGRAVAPVVEPLLGRLWPPKEGFNLPQAERFTAALDIPVICVGGFHSRDAMSDAIASGRCDAVAVARAMIANPYLFRHLAERDPDAPGCWFCNRCIARAGGRPVNCYNPPVRAKRDKMLERVAHAAG